MVSPIGSPGSCLPPGNSQSPLTDLPPAVDRSAPARRHRAPPRHRSPGQAVASWPRSRGSGSGRRQRRQLRSRHSRPQSMRTSTVPSCTCRLYSALQAVISEGKQGPSGNAPDSSLLRSSARPWNWSCLRPQIQSSLISRGTRRSSRGNLVWLLCSVGDCGMPPSKRTAVSLSSGSCTCSREIPSMSRETLPCS